MPSEPRKCDKLLCWLESAKFLGAAVGGRTSTPLQAVFLGAPPGSYREDWENSGKALGAGSGAIEKSQTLCP
jgi:hypothetical protein